MAMLECYEPSLSGWGILEKAADFYVDIGDEQAVQALQRLARPIARDPALQIGESGVAGLAGLIAAATEDSLRDALGLDSASHVLVIGTEGPTDPELYEALLAGRPASPHAVPA
jgi:diaminopropionate ammonia-lyase